MSTEQLRADFESWMADNGYDAFYREDGTTKLPHEIARTAYQAGRAALQSQDMKPVIEALEAAQNNECGPRRPFGSADPNSDDYDHDAFMWDYYQRAIDHARRIEGEGE